VTYETVDVTVAQIRDFGSAFIENKHVSERIITTFVLLCRHNSHLRTAAGMKFG
jgi:hypothetical protein